ncbi:related to FAD binding domain protein [Cephalotrichum gorgonifer]|uniref:Related to FAD binding domain protein n=1 Tax=Cephalotrichum gorgonifer TaxID=2041049 RepID=A0AAE8STA7_9PEZI|nr:related to FAD binding domain protein [Cephalotrichum gorgonifer]
MKEETMASAPPRPHPISTHEEVLDVIIIGAGPCGLSVAARLRETTPAALFTDEEHRRYHWLRRHGRNVALKNAKTGKVTRSPDAQRPGYDMMVLDATDCSWMARWNTLFATYGISHLRSPMLWHVDPADRDSLLSFAYESKRERELVEIRGCVGKEISKHKKKMKVGSRRKLQAAQPQIEINERDRNDYYTPSQAMFQDHCGSIRDRYGLGTDIVSKETVSDISFDIVKGVSINDEKLFTITTNHSKRYARAVVLAVGPANPPKIPAIPGMPPQATRPVAGGHYQSCHSAHIKTFPDPTVQARMAGKRETNIMVVGGGLTSAQLTDLAVRRGVTKVWHLMRGPCKVKAFDVDLSWMGKYRNGQQAEFWSADSDKERYELMREARNGGSITGLYHKKLKRHIADGRVELKTETKVVEAEFVEDAIPGPSGGQWKIVTEPPVDGLPMIDYIYWATGIDADFTSLPYLQTMMSEYPIEECGGLPCLNDDLMWKDGVPLFVAGRLASLKIGPASPNIGGAKLAAERIALAMDELMSGTRGCEDLQYGRDEADDNSGVERYLSGAGSKFSCLEIVQS